MLTHSGERSHKCKVPGCNLAFYTSYHLKRHEKYHEQEKVPFKCEECGKGFKKNHRLREHSFEHTGVPAFSCEHCDKAFRSKNLLQRHVGDVHCMFLSLLSSKY
jgi:KRAB domain-containing zinc finger protein